MSKDAFRELNPYSKEVRAFMEEPPALVVRCGITATLLAILLLITVSFFIGYVEDVPASIKLITENPPEVTINNTRSSFTTINVSNGQLVNKGTTLAILNESRAEYEDFRRLQNYLALLDSSISVPSFKVNQLPILFGLQHLNKLQRSFFKLRRLLIGIKNQKKKLNETNYEQNLDMIDEALSEIKEKVNIWESYHVLRASIGGRVSFNSNINKNDDLFPKNLRIVVYPELKSDLLQLSFVEQNNTRIKKGEFLKIRINLTQRKLSKLLLFKVRSIRHEPNSKLNHAILAFTNVADLQMIKTLSGFTAIKVHIISTDHTLGQKVLENFKGF